jgi:hypothetical protein
VDAQIIRRTPPGRDPSVAPEVALRLVAAAEQLKLWGFPDKVAFDAVAVAGWALLSHRGMSKQIGGASVRLMHKAKAHRVREWFGNTSADPLPPPPGYEGKWPAPRAGLLTKASRIHANPWPGTSAVKLAELLLLGHAEPPGVPEVSPVDGEVFLVDPDIAEGAPTRPPESVPKGRRGSRGAN